MRVEKLVAGGDGLARFEGVPIFVARSAPGDLLLVRITERHPDYGRAEIVELVEAGPERRPAPYPELARTGAADLQHLGDAAQTRLKVEAVRETVEHLGGFRVPADAEVVAGEPWHYRMRTQVHTAIDPATGGILVGYHARGSHDVVHLTSCPLLVPELEALLAELPRHLVGEPPRRLDLAAGDDGALSVAPVLPGLPHGEVSAAVGDFTYAYDARCFFQGHRGLLAQLVERTVGEWTGEVAVDLYAGVGLFSLPLCRRYGRVIAVESDSIAARFARVNARRNRTPNLEVVPKAVESWVPELAALPVEIDRMVVDPPRAGLSSKVREVLLQRRPGRLTYVSCHPATLARDLRQLLRAYRIESFTFFDLFPQTGHMEAVVQLVALPLEEGTGGSDTAPR